MTPKVVFLFVILVFFLPEINFAAPGRVWHVAGTGNDANNGTTSAQAFRTLQKAADRVQPGDEVLIANGMYVNTPGQNTVLAIKTSGLPDAWITWRAKPGHHPEIKSTGWAGIELSGSYHILDGLTVTGGNDSLTLLEALEEAKNPAPNGRFNTNGIFVNGRNRLPAEKPHHVIIRNCTVRKCPGGGIAAIETDYITVEDCQVYENAWYMRYAGSGITTLNNWAFDDKPGYHIIIQRNLVWNNKTLVPWERTGKLSDGNGIILDVTDQGQGATNPNADAMIGDANNTTAPSKPKRPEWKGRALIANNLSAFNGGSGIHTFRTKHVDIVNNTTYWNGQVVGYQELFANTSEDIVMLNNIIVPKPGGKVTSNNRNKNIHWDYNLYPIAQESVKGPHDLVADPKFINAHTTISEANFNLDSGSPARNSGTPELGQSTDLRRKKIGPGKPRNRGCYQN